MYEHVSRRFGVWLLEGLGHVIVPAAMRANRREYVLLRVSVARRPDATTSVETEGAEAMNPCRKSGATN
jgi:hypothetical protein